MKEKIYYKDINLVFGKALMGALEEGSLCGLWFHGQKYFPDRVTYEDDLPKKVLKVFLACEKQLREYEKGERRNFDLALHPIGSDFRQLVWKELLKIPIGETRTYGSIANLIAKKLGRVSMSGQAVGGAVGHNPISIIIPCHRVLAASGQLTGYAGGLDKKVMLLKHEGVKVPN